MVGIRIVLVLWVWSLFLPGCEWGVKQWREPEPPTEAESLSDLRFVDTPGNEYVGLKPFTITIPAHGCNTGDIFVADEHGILVCEAPR